MNALPDDEPFKTESHEDASDLLSFFLWECPTSMIPSHDAVKKWARTLDARGSGFADLANECRDWLEPLKS